MLLNGAHYKESTMTLLIIIHLVFSAYLILKIKRSSIWKSRRPVLEGIKTVYFSIGTSQVIFLVVMLLSKLWEYDVPIVRLLITLCLLQTIINLLIVTSINKRRCEYSQRGQVDVRRFS